MEKLASSEIAQSRERFAQELIDLMRLDFEGRNLPHSTVLRILELAERDTRERVAQKLEERANVFAEVAHPEEKHKYAAVGFGMRLHVCGLRRCAESDG